MTVDGRGESSSYLAGRWHDGKLDVIATQELRHSLGLMYEEVTDHLGFLRSSDEYKVMALAAYGKPAWLDGPHSRATPRCSSTVSSRCDSST